VLSSGIIEDKNRDVDEDIKSLYRTVAKITHPDKVRNEDLNKLYVDATRMVRDNDRIGLYGLAISLGIEVSIPDGMYEDLVAKITEIEAKIRFLESSYHMRWYYSDRQTKIDLVCEYIEKNMLRLSEA
jgi:curved DNA-binding protein CbpA